MAKRIGHSRGSQGFSLLELLIAMVFTALLMAGMAKIFQSSLGAFYTAGEKLSSSRRNRLSLDLLYDDLNTAGMFMIPSDIEAGIPQGYGVSTTNPLFSITPNTTVTIAKGNADGSNLSITADQLLLYADEPLDFGGTLKTPIIGSEASMASANASGGSATVNSMTPTTFDIDCGTAAQAAEVKPGMVAIFRDYLVAYGIVGASVSGTKVTVTPPSASVATQAATGGPLGTVPFDYYGHNFNAPVTIVLPAQQIRYSIQPQFLDPNDSARAIPCLVREQENYQPNGFVTFTLASDIAANNYSLTIVAENVTALKFYLSMNPGDTTKTPDKIWAGYGYKGTTWTDILGTTSGTIGTTVNTQLATYGATNGLTSIQATDLTWFRKAAVAVRADLTTRTAVARADFNQTTTTPTLTYNQHQETLVLVPRHFGLSLD